MRQYSAKLSQQQVVKGEISIVRAGFTSRRIRTPLNAVPPTVSETKRNFLEMYRKPVPGIISPQLNEFVVEQHFNVYNANYMYTEIGALGLVSLFTQVVPGDLGIEPTELFDCFIKCVKQDPEKYREDAAALEAWAKGLNGPEELKGDASGDKFQQLLAAIKARSDQGKFNTTLFFSIGLFRLLELTGAKDPKKLASLVAEVGASQTAVNRQLTVYKSLLSKLKAAKELMEEFLERERRKQAEREASKAAAAEGSDSSDGAKSEAAKEEEAAKASA